MLDKRNNINRSDMNWFVLDLPHKADLGLGRDIAIEDIN